MKKAPTYEDLLAENAALKASEHSLIMRIAYLERMLFGAKRDPKASIIAADMPGLFDDLFKKAMDDKAAEIEKEAQKRRSASRKTPSRPSKYHYHGLEERVTTLMPGNADSEDCDTIGKNITRILHREPAKVWVEVVERPILRKKSDKNASNPHIYQAAAPKAVIGSNHVGDGMLAQIVIDKYRYHLPEYRQVKQ